MFELQVKRLEDLAFAGVLVFFTSQILYATVLTSLLCVWTFLVLCKTFCYFLSMTLVSFCVFILLVSLYGQLPKVLIPLELCRAETNVCSCYSFIV